MIDFSDDEIATLPEEKFARFIEFERRVRERYSEESTDSYSAVRLARRYMSWVLPAAKECGIEELSQWQQPASDAHWDVYDAFFNDVDFCLTALRFRLASHTKKYSVAFDAAAKLKLRHLLDEFRVIVDKLEVSAAKKDRLRARISDLQAEFERDRTRYEAFAAFVIEAMDDCGEVVEKLEPIVQRLVGMFGQEKRNEDVKANLPKPLETKRIEGPTKKNGNNSASPDELFGGEIPF